MAGQLWFAFRGDKMMVQDGGGPGGLARNPAALGLGMIFEEEIGLLDGEPCAPPSERPSSCV